eukprot:s1514_g12.t1
MSSLEAAVGERIERMKEQRSQKQKNRVRLMVDPNITVTSLVGIFTAFLQFKGCSCLESLVEPPPEGPVSFSWHTSPSPLWLSKTSGLLFDLLSVAKNSKLASTKVTKALHVMWKNRDLTLRTSKHITASDAIDKIDYMVRILMNQLRTLKINGTLRARAWRCLSNSDQMRLQMVLERLQLPPELMEGAEEDDEDEEKKGQCFSKAYALKEWGSSLRKAQLLAYVPLGELKRRRFLPKEAETNPFLEQVKNTVPEDVD